MEKILASKKRENLIRCHRKERDKRVCDRIKAVLAYNDGYSYSEIAKILLLDDETIRRHIEDYQSRQKLNTENGGSEGKLTDRETRELIEHLSEITYLYVKDICQYVNRRYRKKYSISDMTKWLHVNNFCYKKPHAVPAKADRKQQKQFINFYKRLKAKAGTKEPIYFADSVHPQHQTQLTYGWIPIGVRKEIATTGRQYRLNFVGGIYLPPYSPNLNPIERLWKTMREQVMYNRYYETFSDFTDAVVNFFKAIGRKKNVLRARITDNFQILPNAAKCSV